jgi:hypothetical protein
MRLFARLETSIGQQVQQVRSKGWAVVSAEMHVNPPIGQASDQRACGCVPQHRGVRILD